MNACASISNFRLIRLPMHNEPFTLAASYFSPLRVKHINLTQWQFKLCFYPVS